MTLQMIDKTNFQDIYKLSESVELFDLTDILLNFDKIPVITGKLNGIKGQYLLFDDNTVLNIRKHTGYVVKVDF